MECMSMALRSELVRQERKCKQADPDPRLSFVIPTHGGGCALGGPGVAYILARRTLSAEARVQV